ncbi:hypothetical protein BCR39DRAFT_374254 [Naematelia encephala]|uniref:Zn(2)-C6 fungal-type domain-containing protein n=1 Tax=Naematelia encephala TaxID=71784 RepID=A0A1Y2BCF4_9TREE|nr:hypothetical protein BCR39DRAFT_374254 [Naematelia encephala]
MSHPYHHHHGPPPLTSDNQRHSRHSQLARNAHPQQPPTAAYQFDSLAPPQLSSGGESYQYPSSVYYSSDPTQQQHDLQHGGVPPIHLFPPNTEVGQERRRSPSSMPMPQVSPPFDDPNLTLPLSFTQPQQQQLGVGSPYNTPTGVIPPNSGAAASDYFPPYNTSPTSASHPFLSSTWQAPPINQMPTVHQQMEASTSTSGKQNSGAKTNRQQFTACGACRHRRVKCDLKDRQEAAELAAIEEEGSAGVGPQRQLVSRRKKVSCTNCQERGTNCMYVSFSSLPDSQSQALSLIRRSSEMSMHL